MTAQLWADSKPLTIPVQTPYKAFKHSRTWNEWLNLPFDYSIAPLSAQVAITIWDLSPTGGEGAIGHWIPFGGTTISLFDSDGTLRIGRQRCHVHRGKRADGLSSTATPHIVPKARRSRSNPAPEEDDPDVRELERLEELIKKHEMGEIPADDWLDGMVSEHMSQLEKKVAKKLNTRSRNRRKATKDLQRDGGTFNGREEGSVDGDIPGPPKAPAPYDDDTDLGHYFLYIDFPRFDHPVVFTDYEYPAPPISTMQPQSGSTPDVQLKPPPEVTLGPGINDVDGDAGPLIRIYDPEIGIRDNPVENKHRRLVRNQRTGVLDRDLKPNAKIRDELANIISYGPAQDLKAEEKDLVWKFRHHLTRNKRALTKFLKSVTWTDASEARQAVSLLPKWTEIDVDDALELLGPTFVNPDVRAYAVDRLTKADDEELLLYLLQLVQALKFEKAEPEIASTAAPEANGIEATTSTDDTADSSLARFLVSRAVANERLGNFLHWYLMVECDDMSPGQAPQHRRLFAKVEYDFLTTLVQQPDGPARKKTLLRQGELITVLSKISKDVRFSREDRPRKIQRLQQTLADPKNELLKIDPPLPLPLDPSVKVSGVYASESNVFKSSLFPLLLTFKTSTDERYPIIFKTGDDLRQDQLVIQIIMLMDRLLRKENLDLKLSPYRILATSTSAGAVQFVSSTPLAAIVSSSSNKYKGSVLNYLRVHNPDKGQPLGVRAEAMDNYVKSCAGYCVITYLLGVGDRHLDNLLIAPTGHFFHADFGYILGRDPKPFAPQMKLSREMVEGMGGLPPQGTGIGAAGKGKAPQSNSRYPHFLQHCFTAYTTLRKSSNLILNLFSLMVDANIPDIRMEPEKAVEKVKERFHLELRTDEEVMRMFEGLVEDSMGAVVPRVVDWTHGFVQRFRA